MMAPEECYVFTGRDGEVIPRHVTHVLIAKALKFVSASAFRDHPNIQEVICHDGVVQIEQRAFYSCPSLRRVIIPGVKELERGAFYGCRALSYIECSKMEIIRGAAFGWCESLKSIDLPSIKIVDRYAFSLCYNLKNANFGKELESIREGAFNYCRSLEFIALPLKDDMITHDDIFQYCFKLNHIDLVGGVHETVSALLMEEWKNDMNEEIDSINQNLASAFAGGEFELGEKAQAIRFWISSLLCKYTHYKAEHRRCLNMAAAALQVALPTDILFKNIFPFIELPSHTFEES